MAEMLKWKDSGAVFAEDLGNTNIKYIYTNNTLVNTPFGKRVYFTNGDFTIPTTSFTSYMYWYEGDSYAYDGTDSYKNGSVGSEVITITTTGFTGVTGYVSDLVFFDRVISTQEVSDYYFNTTFDYDKNIVSNWQLDATDIITDRGVLSKESPNDGTVSGTPTVVETEVGLGLDFETGDYVVMDSQNTSYLNNGTDYHICVILKDGASGEKPLSHGEINVEGWYVDLSAASGLGFVINKPSNQTFRETIDTWDNNRTNIYNFSVINNDLVIYTNDEENGTYDNIDTLVIPTTYNLQVANRGGGSGLYSGVCSKVILLDKGLTELQVLDLNNRIRRGEL